MLSLTILRASMSHRSSCRIAQLSHSYRPLKSRNSFALQVASPIRNPAPQTSRLSHLLVAETKLHYGIQGTFALEATAV